MFFRLNALVIKVFKEASEVHDVLDTSPLCSALEWLFTQQAQDGHFVENKPITKWHREMDVRMIKYYNITGYCSINVSGNLRGDQA